MAQIGISGVSGIGIGSYRDGRERPLAWLVWRPVIGWTYVVNSDTQDVGRLSRGAGEILPRFYLDFTCPVCPKCPF
jgi:hypothetical protein